MKTFILLSNKKEGESLRFDINIDTIVVTFPITSADTVNLDGWRKNGKIYTKKTKTAFYKCDTEKYFLNLQLSLSKLQNGSNEKRYNFYNAFELIKIINDDICRVIKSDSLKIENGILTRIDLNSDLVFSSEKEANSVIKFLKSINAPRTKKKEFFKYAFNISSKTKNNIELRAYRKDEDPALSKKSKPEIPPTVRLEFQFNKSKNIKKFFGINNPVRIMLNPEYAVKAWNLMLEKYRLDAAIYSKRWFFKVAKEILGVKEKTFQKYKKILIKGWNNEKLTVSEKRIFQKITRELYLCGVTPAYCDVEISLIKKLSKKFFKKIIRKIFFKINELRSRNKKRGFNNKSFKKHCFLKYKRMDSS